MARPVALAWVVVVAAATGCGSKKRQTRTHDASPVEPIGLPRDAAVTGASDEIEPNDNDESATPLPLGGSLHGRIDPASDVDFYQVQIGEAGALAVELSAVDQTDLTLEVIDPTATVVARSDRGGVKTKEGIANLGVQPGRYLVAVRMKKPPPTKSPRRPPTPPPPSPVFPYDLTAHMVSVAANAEHEPNDDRGTAGDLIPGDPVIGFIGWADDADSWKLSVEAVSAKNVLDIEVGPVEASAFTLEVADAVGSPLLVRRAPRGGGLTVHGLVPKLAAGAAPYLYVTVRATPSNPESPYQLRVTQREPELDGESEPNDTIDHPMAFPAQRTVVTGWWSPGDVDCYALPIDPAQRKLMVEISPRSEADLAAELVVGGKVIAKSDNKGKGVEEKLVATVPADTAAIVRIRGADGGTAGNYGIRLSEAP